MWIIVKVKNKEVEIFKKELLKKTNQEVFFYEPRIEINNYTYNKKKKLIKNILGNYLFCFHKNFSDEKFVNSLIYTKGLHYFLKYFQFNQSQIQGFINMCKENQNKNGFLTQSFLSIVNCKKAKFISGPLKDVIFQIVSTQKKYIDVLIGKRKIKLNRLNSLSYLPA